MEMDMMSLTAERDMLFSKFEELQDKYEELQDKYEELQELFVSTDDELNYYRDKFINESLQHNYLKNDYDYIREEMRELKARVASLEILVIERG
jgi:chromosome segregation ATPase